MLSCARCPTLHGSYINFPRSEDVFSERGAVRRQPLLFSLRLVGINIYEDSTGSCSIPSPPRLTITYEYTEIRKRTK